MDRQADRQTNTETNTCTENKGNIRFLFCSYTRTQGVSLAITMAAAFIYIAITLGSGKHSEIKDCTATHALVTHGQCAQRHLADYHPVTETACADLIYLYTFTIINITPLLDYYLKKTLVYSVYAMIVTVSVPAPSKNSNSEDLIVTRTVSSTSVLDFLSYFSCVRSRTNSCDVGTLSKHSDDESKR